MAFATAGLGNCNAEIPQLRRPELHKRQKIKNAAPQECCD
jgi:hypothetical protein